MPLNDPDDYQEHSEVAHRSSRAKRVTGGIIVVTVIALGAIFAL
jgi:hypothetical protein